MTFHIVHDGKGGMRKIETPVMCDSTLDAPRRPQRFSRIPVKSFRTFQEMREALETTHTGYRTGKLIDLGPDQCRYTVDDDHTMCGALGYPWCSAHRAVVYARGRTWRPIT